MRIRLAAILAALILAAAAAITTPIPAAEAAPGRHGCLAVPIKDTRGPGLRNWRAYDAYCTGNGSPGKWFGPWRFTRSGAFLDAHRHNVSMV